MNGYQSFNSFTTAEQLFTVGRMTGGGSVFTEDGRRVTHGFEIHCDLRDPNNLEINWKDTDGNENRFHLEDLTGAVCIDTDIDQLPRTAPFDTFIGVGVGRVNNVSGYLIDFIFTDAGEPGRSDVAMIHITDPGGGTVLFVADVLTYGNHQAHKDNKGAKLSLGKIESLIKKSERNTDSTSDPYLLDLQLFLEAVFGRDADRVAEWLADLSS